MNKWLRVFFFLFLIIQINPTSLYGNNSPEMVEGYCLNSWSVKQGLSQNSVKAIIQTRDGYLWLGTQDGLARFNGHDFKIYNQSNTPELKTDHITSLYEDSSGRLWVGTWGGGLCSILNGQFTTYATRNGRPHHIVRCIAGDTRGNLWIGTWGGGVFRFRGNAFTHFNRKQGLSSPYIYTLYPDPETGLWVGTWGGGINHYEDGRFGCVSTQQGLDKEGIMSIAKDHRGVLWAGTDKGKIIRLSGTHVTVYDSRSGLRGNQVLSILADADHQLWAGTWGGGLFSFDGDRFHAFPGREGFTSNIIPAIVQDREKNIWIGTTGAGLSRLKKRRFFCLTTRDGLSHNVIRTILQARDGSIWVGTDGGGLNHLADGGVSVYSTRNGLSSNSVMSLLEDRQGNLWIGTYGGGLNKFSGHRFTIYTTDDGLSGNHIISLAEDRLGNIWAGTWGEGLNRIKEGEITRITMKNGLTNNNIMALHGDQQDRLWIGTGGGGLNTWKNGTIDRYSTRQGLAGNYILSIHEDGEGTLWIGTYNNGLGRFKGGRFCCFSRRHGLYNNTIFGILEDDAGNLWMSSNTGIFRVSKQELDEFASGKRGSVRSFFYNESDGMETAECTGSSQPSGLRCRDGTLWFPSKRGIIRFHPGKIQPNTRMPPVRIEELKVDDNILIPQQDIKIGPGKKTFEFHYAALSYISPEKIKFRYRLIPFNQKWVKAGSRRIAYYTNIPAGKYRFQVTASNSDGLWNSNGTIFRFEYEARFYQTIWFYIMGILVMVSTAVLIHLWRVHRIVIRERKKYEKSRIPPEHAQQYFDKLVRYMGTERPYLEPDINLPTLAKRLMIPDHYLSQIINARLKQNFFDFINSHRIDEAKKKILNPEYSRVSFLQIAFDVGFNSKSAFNRAFKKHTGMTPSQFKRNSRIS